MTSGDIMSAVETIVGIGILVGLVGSFMGGSDAAVEVSQTASRVNEEASVMPFVVLGAGLLVLLVCLIYLIAGNSTSTKETKTPSAVPSVKPKPTKQKPSVLATKGKTPSTSILKTKGDIVRQSSNSSGKKKYNLPNAD